MVQRRLVILGVLLIVVVVLALSIPALVDQESQSNMEASTPISTQSKALLPTSSPAPSPTATPDIITESFRDPFDRYIIGYPIGWHTRPAESETPGFASASYISSFDLAPLFDQKEGELVAPADEFLIAIEFIPETVTSERLETWVRQRDSGIFETLDVSRTQVSEWDVVLLRSRHGPDYSIDFVYIATPNGVLVLSGEPMQSPLAEIFVKTISTLEIGDSK